MTGDISAFLFDPRQGYTGVRLQQGRVITDLDWNEDARIEADRRRRMLADLVCGHGSTNRGFLPLAAVPQVLQVAGANGETERQTYNVRLAPGTFLLGGELHEWPGQSDASLLRQGDWLQLSGLDQAALPSLPEAARTDLVYLEVFERTVTAVEDRELRERALGGPDTSTRTRAFRRVRVLEDVPDDCTEAGLALRTAATAPRPGDTSGQAHGFDEVTCEVLSKARLTVDFAGPGPSGDLCKPRVAQGYLGAENQAIRVQLSRADRFLWAYDNAAPLYRVQVTDETPGPDGSVELTFLTRPNDPELFPLEDMVVEVLPWDAVLSNAEKTAAGSGHLSRVTGAYDPGTATLRIAPEVPGDMLNWLASSERDGILSPRDPETEQRFFYLRVWQPGPEGGGLTHGFQPGTAVELPGTGLTVSFSANGLPGDYWVIAARPNTPDRVMPWRLLDASAPFGPKRFYASLGLVAWSQAANGQPDATVRDCRHRFRKLCNIETCCTVHVGDGNVSTGDTTDLQAAIDSLPQEGGRVCLLPGRHLARAALTGLSNVTIEGCGPRSVLIAAEGQTAPLITVTKCVNTVLRNFATEAAGVQHVLVDSADGLDISELVMRGAERALISGTSLRDLRIERCELRTGALTRALIGQGLPVEPAIFIQGRGMAVTACRIETAAGNTALTTALGGVQIAGDSRDILIADNLIRGGNGAGIVLGSVDFQPVEVAQDFRRLREHYALHQATPLYTSALIPTAEGCLELEPRPNPQGGDDTGQPLVPISDGPVEDCRIRGNHIDGMGASGITAAFWFLPDSESDAIVTDRLEIDNNRITGCMRLSTAAIPEALRQVMAFGGITLATGEDIAIRENRITGLANNHPSPIVGIFALDATAIEIQRNHLRDNGQLATLESDIGIGLAGGILLMLVRPGIDFTGIDFDPDRANARQDGAAACVVEDNTVVAREGRALTVIGVGPMMIHGNRLTAHGSNSLSRFPFLGALAGNFNLTTLAIVGLLSVRQVANPLLAALSVLGGSTVAVLNLGLSNEIYLQALGFSGLGLIEPPQENPGIFDDDIKLLANGNILFNDNQVVFDSLSPAITLTLSSTLLISLDDVAVQDNQFDCDLGFDFVGINTVAIGWSVRMQGNRMKEGILNAFLSGLTVGLMNDTSHNQGTHCFTVAGGFQPRVTATGLPAGASVVLDTNRHVVPEERCIGFNQSQPDLTNGFGLTERSSSQVLTLIGE